MREIPVLFNGAMVRAILDDSKTQTRRPLKLQPVHVVPFMGRDNKPTYEFGLCMKYERAVTEHVRSPLGKPGDRLWVRETFGFNHYDDGNTRAWKRAIYRADGLEEPSDNGSSAPWRPSIHMPRRFARLFLDVLDVRIERLQDISEEDARAEGARFVDHGDDVSQLSADGGETWGDVRSKRLGWSMEHPQPWDRCLGSARMAFANAWTHIYGAESWAANPWVWVTTFRKVP